MCALGGDYVEGEKIQPINQTIKGQYTLSVTSDVQCSRKGLLQSFEQRVRSTHIYIGGKTKVARCPLAAATPEIAFIATTIVKMYKYPVMIVTHIYVRHVTGAMNIKVSESGLYHVTKGYFSESQYCSFLRFGLVLNRKPRDTSLRSM